MIFPDQLYRLSERDEQARHLVPFVDSEVATSGADMTIALRTVPATYNLLLTTICAFADPVTDILIALSITMTLPNSGIVNTVHRADNMPSGAGVERALNYSGQLLLPPGAVLSATANFAAAVAGKTLLLAAYGILFPIGNIERSL